MEQRKNIVLFTGKNRAFLQRDFRTWKELFTKKHGDFNLIDIEGYQVEAGQLTSELLTPGFMGMHRMIVLHGLMDNTKKDDTNDEALEEKISSALEDIPDTNIVVFIQSDPKKTAPLYKALQKIATVKEYKELSAYDVIAHIQKIATIDNIAAKRLAEKKQYSLSAIEKEIFKLQSYSKNITNEHVQKYVSSELSDDVFAFSNAVFAKNIPEALRILDELVLVHSPFRIVATLLGQIRKQVLVHELLACGYADKDVISQLKLTPKYFAFIKKRVSFLQNMRWLYSKLVQLDFAVKTGGTLGADQWVHLGLQKILLSFNKV